mmetsp:Transcript_932/g.1232  ORF Transcript_932/g.1232 Transcript_932/m.1232 type:complete len:726 (+) Transcript_932:467-2644(+)
MYLDRPYSQRKLFNSKEKLLVYVIIDFMVSVVVRQRIVLVVEKKKSKLIEASKGRVAVATHRFYQKSPSTISTEVSSVPPAKSSASDYKETYSGSFLDEYTNDNMVEEAFERCDINNDGKLEFPEFKNVIEKFPEILEFLDQVFEKAMRSADPAEASGTVSAARRNSKPNKRRASNEQQHSTGITPNVSSSQSIIHGRARENSNSDYESSDHSIPRRPPKGPYPAIPDRLLPRSRSHNSIDLGTETDDSLSGNSNFGSNLAMHTQEDDDDTIHHEGYLQKIGAKTNNLFTRYFALVGKCLYYFHKKTDTKPKGLIFLGGCHIEKIKNNSQYGFRIVHLDSERLGQKQHTLYATSETERDAWCEALLVATSSRGGKSGSFDVGQYYDFEDELGTGRFAIARKAIDKKTKARVAIKSIEKRHSLLSEISTPQAQPRELQPNSDPDQPPVILDPAQSKNERDMFRREISIMRLAQHKYVLPLLSIFEDRSHVHLVMPLMSQDLGHYLTKRYQDDDPCTEKDALICMPVIIEAVAYLHHMGIIHRDLKPDNILLEDPDDITRLRLADFSISQILKPGDTINKPAGSIEYMAPEVFLKNIGASFPADIWAVGVIGLIVLFFKQPFAGDSKGETITNILEHEIIPDYDWSTCTSTCRDLFLIQMIHADASKRITAQQALESHPWLEPWRQQHFDTSGHYHLSHQIEDGDDDTGTDTEFLSSPNKTSQQLSS